MGGHVADPFEAYVFGMEVRVLGPLEVLREGIPLPVGGPKQRTVLALLAASPGHMVSTDALILGLYGTEAPSGALRTIHTYVSNLRHEVGDLIVRSGEGYRLSVDELSTVDSEQFEELYSRGSALLGSDPAGAGKALREALSLWRGHAFADVEAHGSLDPEITRLAELRVSALELRVEADLAQGGHREFVGELEALCEEYPLRESFRAQHMLALYRAGRQAEALRAYTRTRAILAEELGIEPTPRLQRLEEMILTQDPQLDLPPAVTIEHRAVLTAELGDPWIVRAMRERDSGLARRDAIISSHAIRTGGSMLDVRGSAALAVFPSVSVALDAAVDLAVIGLQIAIDQGEVEVSGDRISGPPVNRSLRLAAIANPGQVIISSEAHAALTASGVGGWSVVSLGTHQIRGLDRPDQLFQLIGEGLVSEFGSLRLDRMPQPSPGDRPSGPLPGYELRGEIGANSYSVVQRAYQASVGREVAVRVFSPELVSNPHFIRRFEAVAQRIAAVDHPHLVPLLDFWRQPGRAILVNRLIDGGSLQHATLDPHADVDDPAALIEKIGSSLVVAHQYGLVHGQVGSKNVLFDQAGNPYLSDLGVATIVQGLVRGVGETPMTPDTDVFGLGTMLDEVAPSGEARLRQVVLRATDSDPKGRYGSMSELVEDLRADAPGSHGRVPSAVRNPYKGLASYEVGDNADFYGRDDLIGELVEAVVRQTLTMVVGPSGIGKSSVVKAGLIPALRGGAAPGSEGWLFADMYPGDHPFDGIEDALERVAQNPPEMLLEAVRVGTLTLPEAARLILADGVRMVLVVDQFEELFTHDVDEDERLRFLSALAEVAADPDSPVRVVATVRADFFDRPLQYAEFGVAISGGVVTVSAPTRRELAEIVVLPAEGVGVELEPALVDTLISDADSEIGGLPLLQHALTELFESRGSDRITFDEYRSSGGLEATVGRRAEQVFRSLDGGDQELARQIFLTLVSVDEDVDYTRRRVRAVELEGLGSRPAVQRVLEAFGNARLVVFDRDSVTRGPTVEVAHEALIVFWDRYRGWVDEVRDDLLARRRVEIATREWLGSGEEAAYLMTGGRLERAESWRDRSGMRVGSEETRFLSESRRAVDAENARVSRNRRRALAGLSAALAVVLALGVFAWTQRNVAERNAMATRVQELVAQAELAMSEDPSLAINLALEAYEEAQALGGEIPGEVMRALQTTVQSSRLIGILPDAGSVDSMPVPSWHPDMTALAVGSSTNPREVVVYSTDGFAEMARFDAGAPVYQVRFAPDGETIAVSYLRTSPESSSVRLVSLFEVGTWVNVEEYVGPCCAAGFEFNPDGRFLAVAGWTSDRLEFTTVWNADEPDRPYYVYEDAYFESWSPDSSEFLAVQVDPNVVHVVVAATGEPAAMLELSSPGSFPSFRPGGTDLAVTLHDEEMTRVLSRSGDLVAEHPGPAITLARFAPDGDRLIQWGSRDDVVVTSLSTGATLRLHGHRGGGVFATPSSDGRLLAVTTEGGETLIWDLTDTGPEALGNRSIGGVVWSAEPSIDGSTWDAVRLDGETAHGVRISTDGSAEDVGSTVFQHGFQLTPISSPSGLIGGQSVDGRGSVEDVVTGETVFELAGEACPYPVALDDPGELVLIGGGTVCGYDAGGGGVLDLATGEYLFELPVLPIYGAFGHPGTPTEDIVVINTGFDEMTMEVRRIPEGDILASIRVDSPSFRPFISADGRWVSWGSASSGGVLFDLEALAEGAAIDDALVLNPHVESGATNFTRAGGDYVATSASRGVIRVWRIDTGELWFTLPESEHPTFTWQFISDDGRYLYYADRTVIRRMPLDPDQLASLARERAMPGFSAEECRLFLSDQTDCSGDEG